MIAYPWKRPTPGPYSHYETDGPTERVRFKPWGDVEIEVTPTAKTGLHSGRTRFHVLCVTCNEVIHEATTGPSSMTESHLAHAHGMVRS